MKMIKYIKCEQRSAEWYNYRLGVATASNFNKIMTNKTLKESKNTYIYELVSEKILKGNNDFKINEEMQPCPDSNQAELEYLVQGYDSFPMVRGRLLEKEAIKSYQFMTKNVISREVGFILSSCKRYGCSPDGLIGEEGGIETKCPLLSTQLKYLQNKELLLDAYKHQVYGFLFVSGRLWIDLFSYHSKTNPILLNISITDKDYLLWEEAFLKCLDSFFYNFNKLYEEQQ